MSDFANTPAKSHFRQPLLTTPFHARAMALSQVDRFVAWAGYTTVDVFTTVEQEYFAVRNACSLFDLTPMVKYRITGVDAERYLNRLVTRNVAKLKVNRVAYTVWCNDAGHVIDDGTIFRMGPAEFLLCTAERQLNWLLDSAIGFDVGVAEVTETIAALSLQGPTSCSVLRMLGLDGVDRLKPFDIGRFTLAGCAVTVSRTGFTGDLGYELWMAPGDAACIWDNLMKAGATRGIRAIGSLALDMVRIEAGFIMPNLDFVSAETTVRVGRDRSPFELGLDWVVDLAKGHFNGRRALLAEKRRGPARRLVGLDIDGNKPAHAALLYADKTCRKQVGSVTSAMWSPTCKRNIALAMVDAPYFEMGRGIWAEIYLCRELVWERRVARAAVVEKPFFAPERRKLTPPADR
jgi:aminomethyltransferase